MRELNPAGTVERAHTQLQVIAHTQLQVTAHTQLQVTTARGSELIVPRLRGVSHAAAFFLAVVAAVVIVGLAPTGRAPVAVAISGAALPALLGGSALYPRWPGPARLKPMLQRIDH